ncbi:unnamed protein product [Mycena citricolor]|uniref:F-box domain-containing protein n=1 Tax=Mycena citricolor TaxID=2018698 RepID=A0AAD2H6Z3_9AGAR|nr:unnamed protein product [Mycena citricolor]
MRPAESDTPPEGAQARLDALRAEVSRLDDTLVLLATLLSEVQSQRQAHLDAVAELQTALSPIRRLPPELLAHVFMLCAAATPKTGRSILNARSAPMLLGQVCSRWREVLHATPSLWSTVVLHTTPGLARKFDEGDLRTIFQFSQMLPVDVAIYGRDSVDMEWFWDAHTRLQHLRLETTGIHALPASCRTTLPLLASVTLIILHESNPLSLPLLGQFRRSPRLTSLRLESPKVVGDILDVSFPWSQLTYLDLHLPLPVLTARNVVAQCSSLQHCRLKGLLGVATDEKERTPNPGVTLPSLCSLQFLLPGAATSIFLRSFTLPALKSLAIENAPWLFPVLRDLQARSRFALERLVLRDIAASKEDVVAALNCLSLLRSLTLDSCHSLRRGLLAAFTYPPPSKTETSQSLPLALARLETLRIVEAFAELDGGQVADMVEGLRKQKKGDPFPVIRRVELQVAGHISHTGIERLRSMVACGFLVWDVS